MKKIAILTLLLSCVFCNPAFSGGVDNKQNLSTKYLGSFTRNAATDSADAVFYNPAGTVRLKDGLHIQLDTQYISKDYSHQVGGTQYTADDPTLMPSFAAVYKKANWSVFGGFHISGGGGDVDYEDGNNITHFVKTTVLPSIGITDAANESIRAESLYYTYSLGGAYAINDQWSVAAAGRYLKATKDFEASADMLVGAVPIGDLQLGFEQDDDAFGYVLGVNYTPVKTVNLALRYESEMDIDWDTRQTTNDMLGNAILNGLGYTDGSIHSRNLPAVVGLGAQWQATDRFTLGTAFTMYLEKWADWDGEEDNVRHNSYDIAISGTYALTQALKVSAGYMYTKVGINPNHYTLTEMMSPVLNAHTVGVGLSYDYTERLTLMGSLAGAFYESDYANQGLGAGTQYDKTNYLIGLGIAYRFF